MKIEESNDPLALHKNVYKKVFIDIHSHNL